MAVPPASHATNPPYNHILELAIPFTISTTYQKSRSFIACKLPPQTQAKHPPTSMPAHPKSKPIPKILSQMLALFRSRLAAKSAPAFHPSFCATTSVALRNLPTSSWPLSQVPGSEDGSSWYLRRRSSTSAACFAPAASGERQQSRSE